MLVVVLSFLGLDEFYRMAMPERRFEGLAASLVGSLLPLVLFRPAPVNLLLAATATMICFALLFLFRIREIKKVGHDAALLVLGLAYVPLLLCHLLLLRMGTQGISLIFLLLVIVMSGDTGAYYVGSALGRHKLYPRVSPNKSIEGSIGGLLGSIIGAFVVRATLFPELTPLDCVATALLLGSLGQLGDLFESLLKRSFGVKDSGWIIPGHGGILDRLDSILFAAPAAFYYAFFFMN